MPKCLSSITAFIVVFPFFISQMFTLRVPKVIHYDFLIIIGVLSCLIVEIQ